MNAARVMVTGALVILGLNMVITQVGVVYLLSCLSSGAIEINCPDISYTEVVRTEPDSKSNESSDSIGS